MIIWKGDWTEEEKRQVVAVVGSRAGNCTKNHTGHYIRLPEFAWDEVISGISLSDTLANFQMYLRRPK